jgi:hypothetical protein
MKRADEGPQIINQSISAHYRKYKKTSRLGGFFMQITTRLAIGGSGASCLHQSSRFVDMNTPICPNTVGD